jgi:hypothetical protein
MVSAIIEAYDEATHTATVRPQAHPAALWADLPVSADCPGEHLTPGAAVVVLQWDDLPGLVLAPYGGRPVYPAQGVASHAGQVAFTATTPTAFDAVAVTLSHQVASRYWIWLHTNMRSSQVRTAHTVIEMAVDGVAQAPYSLLGYSQANGYWQAHVALATEAVWAAGTHTVTPHVTVVNAGDLVYLRWTHLSVLALPG